MASPSEHIDFDVRSIGSTYSEDLAIEHDTVKDSEARNVGVKEDAAGRDLIGEQGKGVAKSHAAGDRVPHNNADETGSTMSDTLDERPDFGMICEVKKLFGWERPSRPEDDEGYAVIVHYRVSRNEAPGRNRVQNIIVQSPLLNGLLSQVFADYEGLTVQRKTFRLQRPLDPFFHRWSRFQKAIEDEKNALTQSHARLLYDVLLDDLKDTFSARDELVDHGMITWDLLWVLFPPGEPVFLASVVAGGLIQVEEIGYDAERFVIYGKYVDYKGTSFGYVGTETVISSFFGTKPISELSAYPAQFHVDVDMLAKLTARGRRFESLKGYQYKSYDGLTESPVRRDGHRARERIVGGRIIIDACLYNRFHPTESHFREPIGRATTEDPQSLTDEECALCCPFVRGFSLRDKRWAIFHVDNVKDIEWDDTAVENMVLPDGYKELIVSVAKGHADSHNIDSSLFKGKGQGAVILLTGEPGIGKTLTVESVAEQMRMPLYSFSAAELGLETFSMESILGDIFEISRHWKAILLLEDAEVLLQYRRFDKPEKRKLASIFQRMLEFHNGIVFLTSRPVSPLDKAFESRIHLPLHYPALDRAARMRIWRNLIGSQLSSLDGLDKFDFEALAERKMNGREIKKVIQAAQLLAFEQKNALGPGHIQTVLRITQIGQELETQV